MSSELTDLYQEVVLDHSKRPRNFGPMPEETHRAEGLNPLSGDRITIHARLSGGVLSDIRFEGSGCAISRASASVMTGLVKGKSPAEIDAMFQAFHRLVTEGPRAGEEESMGKLAVFAGVHEFPARVKCASLAWHTVRAALENQEEPVSTE